MYRQVSIVLFKGELLDQCDLRRSKIFCIWVRHSIKDQAQNFIDDSFINLDALWELTKSRLTKKTNNMIGFIQVISSGDHVLL